MCKELNRSGQQERKDQGNETEGSKYILCWSRVLTLSSRHFFTKRQCNGAPEPATCVGVDVWGKYPAGVNENFPP